MLLLFSTCFFSSVLRDAWQETRDYYRWFTVQLDSTLKKRYGRKRERARFSGCNAKPSGGAGEKEQETKERLPERVVEKKKENRRLHNKENTAR